MTGRLTSRPPAFICRPAGLVGQGHGGAATEVDNSPPTLASVSVRTMAQGDIFFPPFRFDGDAQRLWRGNAPVQLRPKTFAVLRYLLEHPGHLVTKDELLENVWPDTVVSQELPRISIGELRRALGDDRWAPKFIETVHGRGFRWIGGGRQATVESSESEEISVPNAGTRTDIVGRETELEELHRWFEHVRAGERQIVFVTGEAGIGKTALVHAFVDAVGAHGRAPLQIAFGQCLAVRGMGEAYMPVLEALGELGRGLATTELVDVLRQYAPTWLLQLSSLLSAAELDALHRQLAGIPTTRVVSGLVDALDALAQKRPLLLVLEDLHWSDHATIGLLAALAQRRRPARLMVIGTYSPADAIAHGHPLAALKPELQRRRLCREIALAGLTEMATRAYCDRRFPAHNFADELPQVLVAHTDGNPLFIGATIDHLIASGRLAEVNGQWRLAAAPDNALGVPESLRELIELQLAGLDGEAVRVLEAASVAGTEFASQAVAVASSMEVEEVEAACTELARRGQLVRALGSSEWPDGSVGGRFAFQHALYQNVLYGRVPPARRQRLHRCIGERLERGYAARSDEIAAELAMHFERGGDEPRTIRYLRELARRSGERGAYNEAIASLRRALALLGRQPDVPARTLEQLKLQLALADFLRLVGGIGYPEVEEIYTCCCRLSEEVDDRAQQFLALSGLMVFYIGQARLDEAVAVGRRLLSIAEAAPLPDAALVAHAMTGAAQLGRGELNVARTHLERALAAKAEQQASMQPDFRTVASTCLAFTCALLGYTDQARAYERESLAHLDHAGSYYDRAAACILLAHVECILGDRAAAAQFAAECVALASRHGFLDLLTRAQIMTLWARALDGRREDVAELDRRVPTLRPDAYGPTSMLLPFFLSLSAEAHAHIGDVSTAVERLAAASACIAETGEHLYEAEVHRLRGEFLITDRGLQIAGSPAPRRARTRNPQFEEAEACFKRALAVAQQQEAKLFELRAAISLARLWRGQGKRAAARNLLAPVYGWFTEGLDTADAQAAKTLLDELT